MLSQKINLIYFIRKSENKDENIKIIDLQDALDENFLKKYETDKNIDELYNNIIKETPSNYDFQPEDLPVLDYELRYYQRQAIDSWLLNKKGIFKFATGAGKTKTAIYLCEELKADIEKFVYIIVVPDKTLVNQWADELLRYKYKVVKCFSDNSSWNITLKDYIDIYNSSILANQPLHYYIVVTNNTFFGDKFQKELKKLNDNYFLIVDECHSWGTNNILSKLPKVKIKLGLSATPELFFSKEKTTTLINYFGGIVYEYPLGQAIRENRLVPYKYIPIIVGLNLDEKEKYDEITSKIVKLIGHDPDDVNDSFDKALKMLLFKKARV